MLLDVRKVFSIQQRSSGFWLTSELFLSKSFKDAGRCYDRESALDTGRINLEDDFQIVVYYELNEGPEYG